MCVHSFIKDTTPLIAISLFLSIFFLSFLTSCRSAYQAALPTYKKIYSARSSRPDYSDFKYWAAHPLVKDLSDSIPQALMNEQRDQLADVFFIHPTTFLKHKRKFNQINADVSDPVINAKTDYSTILYQASVFNGSCRVYAPRYRQAHIAAFYTKDSPRINQAFDTAYEDIKRAFDYYLRHENNQRPIIIASHSQGTLLAARLLKDFFYNKPLRKQLVVAYLWGMPLPPSYFTYIPLCNDSVQTDCLAGWRLFKKGYIPKRVREENFTSLVVNPLTWQPSLEYVDKKNHKGAVLFQFNKVYPQTQGAIIKKGVLWIDKPSFPFSFLYTRRNYHAGDINLFYIDIRENVAQRIKHFLLKRDTK